jgi:DNA-binding transcriptional MerR regulator
MPSTSPPPATRIEISGPQLRPDQAGYVLDGRFVDGFADAPTLDVSARRRIAGWAHAFGHVVDDAQLALLQVPEPEDAIGLELLSAAARNTDVDLPLAAEFGLYDRLTDDERRLVREPWHGLPGSERRDYPLNVTELAKLTGTTAKQVREWESATLLPGARIDGRRQFFSAAVVHAFALQRLSRFQVAALANVVVAEDDDVFLALLEHTLATRRRRRAGGSKITDVIKRAMAQLRALLDIEPKVASSTAVQTTSVTKATIKTTTRSTPEHLAEKIRDDHEELVRGAFVRTLCIMDSLDEVSFARDTLSERTVPSFRHCDFAPGHIMTLPGEPELVVFPRADAGWTLSADLGVHVARKADAVRLAKAINTHIEGSALRVYSKDDGQLIKSSRQSTPRQPA